MRIRQLITRLVAVAGIAAAIAGYLIAWQNDDMFVGSVWMVLGVGLMASSAIYSMAMDDPQSREKALTTGRTTHAEKSIDLRDRETLRTARQQAARDEERVSV
ncbi:MAG: hypothetical protein QOI95_4101 [Acidimicrobiaceae bacterium]|jgi:hypothetical protein